MRLSKISIISACLIGACTKSASEDKASEDKDRVPSAPPVTATALASGTVQLPGGRTVADVAAKVTPSVVNVFSERTLARPSSPFHGNPLFEHFFEAPTGPMRQRGLGSGVIVAADGVILTNNHVVANADKIQVAVQDGRELDAKIVGTDPATDIAVLRVDAKQLPAIETADSSKIRIGDLVLAIGNPFGIGQTVTMGIISAVGRANVGITETEDFIQTDAAINPGNSGGALVDMEGRLVGINTAIASRNGGYQGIGFAIPSNMALQVKNALLKHGKVTRGYLGVAIQDITDQLARSLDLKTRRGVLVSDVTGGSPAAKAGLARGDVITSIDGKPTTSSAQLRNAIALAGKGKAITLEVDRDGTSRTVEVTLGETPADRGGTQVLESGILSGITVQGLDRASRLRLDLPSELEGVLVTRVDPRSAVRGLGLREGDVIVEVNRKPIKDVTAFQNAARTDDRSILLLVYRDGATVYLSLTR